MRIRRVVVDRSDGERERLLAPVVFAVAIGNGHAENVRCADTTRYYVLTLNHRRVIVEHSYRRTVAQTAHTRTLYA